MSTHNRQHGSYVKIDACFKNCMIFYKNDAGKEKCDVCGASRYEEGGTNKVPKKVVLYQSITSSIQRLYMHEETANLMRYHASISEDQHGANGDKQSA